MALLEGACLGIAVSLGFHTALLLIGTFLHFRAVMTIPWIRPVPRTPIRFSTFVHWGVYFFLPAGIVSSIWVVRNYILTGYPAYPYGAYMAYSASYPVAGTIGATMKFRIDWIAAYRFQV